MNEDFKEIFDQLKAEAALCKQLRVECTQLWESAEALQVLAKEFNQQNLQ